MSLPYARRGGQDQGIPGEGRHAGRGRAAAHGAQAGRDGARGELFAAAGIRPYGGSERDGGGARRRRQDAQGHAPREGDDGRAGERPAQAACAAVHAGGGQLVARDCDIQPSLEEYALRLCDQRSPYVRRLRGTVGTHDGEGLAVRRRGVAGGQRGCGEGRVRAFARR